MKARRLARLKPETSAFHIRSSLYDLSVTSFKNYTPHTLQNLGRCPRSRVLTKISFGRFFPGFRRSVCRVCCR